jgi:UDP-N-acetyl-D-glucosamine/UDP-N-acetyl-D-galactosamine dehydrogenase
MNSNNKKICLIGLGYVGLPLAAAFAEKFQVVGFDINQSRVDELEGGHDKTFEIEDGLLQSVKSNITYTTNIQDAKGCNIYIVTVPTPIDSTNRPDLTPLIESSKTVGSVLSTGDIVIYESTVYPGVTEDICVPELEKSSGMKFNQDFFCGYSPERINPGDKEHTVTKILKVTSGSTPEIAKQVDELYKEVITVGTYLASSIKVAEASKVIENTQRDVNIALINELALIFDQMGIDTNEVIEAAATKWNFIKLTPGLVGGHCIGIDPYYLTFKAEEVGYKPDLILAARQINNGMSKYIADQTIKEMIKAGKTIKGAEVLILGLTFKEDCPDMRNTKVIDIIEELKDFGVNIDVYDPWVDHEEESEWYKHGVINNPLDRNKKYDAIIVAVGHKQFKAYTQDDYDFLSGGCGVIIDVKNIVDNPTWRL